MLKKERGGVSMMKHLKVVGGLGDVEKVMIQVGVHCNRCQKSKK